MATVYAVASSKGGVGKTTTTVNLGATLASAGLSVAVVDGDIGMANLGDALGVDPDGATLHDVLAETADVEDAVYEGPAGLAVVPGDTSIDGFRAADPKNLANVLDALGEYDYVLVDTGAGLSHDTVLPLGLADEVVLVSTTERDSLTDTEKTREVVDRLGGSTRGVVLTCVDPDDPNAEEVAERLAADVIEAIPVDPVVRESMRLSDPLATHAPASAAASAYRALAAGLTGESIPTPEAVDEEAAATDEEAATDESDGAETADADSEQDSADADSEQDSADTGEAGVAGDVTLDTPAAEPEDEGITLTDPETEATEEMSTDEGSAGDDDESELAADGDSFDEATETGGADEAASGTDDIGDDETLDATDGDDTESDGTEESAADDADEVEAEAEADDADETEPETEDADETEAEAEDADDAETGETDDTNDAEISEADETEADEADDPSGLTDDDALAADTEPSDDPLVADSAEPDPEDSDESEAEGEPVFTTSLVEEAEPTDGRTDDETDERETTSDTDEDVDLVETDDEEEDDDSGRGFLGRLLG